MVYKQADDRIRPCGGTCGRMTRHSRMTLKDAPNTVYRISGNLCGACAKLQGEQEPAEVNEEQAAAEQARKERLQAERIAAAHRARQVLEAQRRERQAAAGRRHLAAQMLRQRGLISA